MILSEDLGTYYHLADILNAFSLCFGNASSFIHSEIHNALTLELTQFIVAVRSVNSLQNFIEAADLPFGTFKVPLVQVQSSMFSRRAAGAMF